MIIRQVRFKCMLRRLITKKDPQPRVFAFIDNQNLNLGVQSVGWKMDWRKLRQLLREKYHVGQAYMFMGYVPEYENMYKQMYEMGYNVILRPTVGMFANEEDRPAITKGNVDVDLVLQAMIQYRNYDKSIIVSGDGDFYGLIEYLVQNKKLLHVMTPTGKYSSLLNEFKGYIIRIDKLRAELAYKNHRPKKKYAPKTNTKPKP